ncbi:hypothetical protein Sjap_003747 [Stephania japonica]|uniref:Myb-like domain-containing protein n=1 Tax=Stephania japonica TaxID=461633 RepID=A0AAP0KPD9_9MAGN
MADHHHQQQQGGTNMVITTSTTSTSMREYRKGNWTVHETMVLIEAKRMDEERRMKRSSSSGGGESSEGGNVVMRSRPAELRWKWVEDYCWSNGCLRSQNQCNDKWDNLMRDYKKVRDYERRVLVSGGDGGDHDSTSQQQQQQQQQQHGSYWKLEKHERKDRNLPTNMLPQIYEALVELLERRSMTTSYSLPIISTTHHTHNVHQPSSSVLPPTPSMPTSHQQNPSPVHQQQPLPLPPPQPSPTTFDSDTSDHSNSPAKRRRRGGGGEGTTSTSTYNEGVGTAISRGATIIAEALQACEDREERRHRECLSVQERRLKIEESKTETDREAINGLVHAINNLATSIFALVSDKSSQQTTPPK